MEYNDHGYLNNKTFLIFDTSDGTLRCTTRKSITGDLSLTATPAQAESMKDSIADYIKSSLKNRSGVKILSY